MYCLLYSTFFAFCYRSSVEIAIVLYESHNLADAKSEGENFFGTLKYLKYMDGIKRLKLNFC